MNEVRPGRFLHGRALLFVAISPFFAAIVASVAPVNLQATAQPDREPELAFDQYGVSLGEIGALPAVEAHFTFVNRGQVPVTLTEIEPGCGCLRWGLYQDKRTYQPGERGQLTVRMLTANESAGPHHYEIAVQSRGEEIREDRLSFRVILPERKLTIEPREVYFYQLSGDPDSRTIYLTDHRSRDSDVQVLAAQCSSDQVTVKVHPPERDEQGLRRIPIELSVPGSVRSGRDTGVLRVETSDPEFPAVFVSLMVQGPEREYGPPSPYHGEPPVLTLVNHETAMDSEPDSSSDEAD